MDAATKYSDKLARVFIREKGANSDANSSEDSDLDLLGIISDDPILYKKQLLVQRSLDEIGLRPFHWKLFCLNGFGYAADSALVSCQLLSQTQVNVEFDRTGSNNPIYGVSTASAVGLLAGAIFWGLGADAIGRRLAFNSSLFVCAIFVLIAGAMPSFISFCALVALYSAGAGGNYILDATNFLEFLPKKYAYLTTILAIWWGVGYLVTALLAWAFFTNFSCASVETCTYSNNKGWRYLHYTVGGLMFVLAILRVVVIRMPHTPKWLVTQGRDAEAVAFLTKLGLDYDVHVSITEQKLSDIGALAEDEGWRWSWKKLLKHSRGLYATKPMAWSTTLVFALWILIGIANPLYSTFLPYYLSTRGYDDSTASTYITWRNYVIEQVCGLVGPLLALPLIHTKYIERRGTLAIGALLTMAFQFGLTQIKTPTQNLALNSVIGAVSNIFFGALYGVTPELFPTSSRATGYGISVAINRICNIMANIIAGYADVTTSAPLFVCAALNAAIALVSLLIPIEPAEKIIP